MERPNTIITKKPARFILFSEIDRSVVDVPPALSLEDSLVTAYGLLRVVRNLSNSGHDQTTVASEAASAGLLSNDEAAIMYMDGQMLTDRSDALVKFASDVISLLSRDELLELQGPAQAYVDAQYEATS